MPTRLYRKRLFTTLHKKVKYVLHYRDLQLYVKQGLKVPVVHRIQFDRSQWLKPYVELKTELRTPAAKEFEKNFHKIMTNSIFGKTIREY